MQLFKSLTLILIIFLSNVQVVFADFPLDYYTDGASSSIMNVHINEADLTTYDKSVSNVKATISASPNDIVADSAVSLIISLDTGGVVSLADWWLINKTPDGVIRSFDFETLEFKQGLFPVFQGFLLSFGPVSILSPELSEPGDHKFYFGVDLKSNGRIDILSLSYDQTTVNVSNDNGEGSPTLAGCPILPSDNIWNTPVDTLPTVSNSDLMIDSIGRDVGLHPDFGSGTWNGAPIGIPVTVVNSGQPAVPVSFDYADESDPGPYPIPPEALIEGGAEGDGDRHVLVLNQDDCMLYELYSAWPQNGGDSWLAGSGAVYDLRSNALRPDGWTSADAAGLPILPGLVRYEEAASGDINHAIRFTVSQTRNEYIWPARHKASSLEGTQYPPMGQRFRLKADKDISDFSFVVQTILRAMKKYGIIVADNGSDWFITGAPDERWDDDELRRLGEITGNDFEAVDTSGLMVDPDSGEVNISSQP